MYTSCNVGTSTYPKILVAITTTVAVSVPYKHVKVEYLKTDHFGKVLPPNVYKAHPAAAKNKIISGIRRPGPISACKFPFVTTRITPMNAPKTVKIVNK